MTGDDPKPTALSQKKSKVRIALCAFVMIMTATVSSACRSQVSRSDNQAAQGVIIVNAPATGEIRRVLVREGMSINKDAPLVEIAVRTEAPNTTPVPTEDPQARRQNIQDQMRRSRRPELKSCGQRSKCSD